MSHEGDYDYAGFEAPFQKSKLIAYLVKAQLYAFFINKLIH
jgi:hypothetical protein